MCGFRAHLLHAEVDAVVFRALEVGVAVEVLPVAVAVRVVKLDPANLQPQIRHSNGSPAPISIRHQVVSLGARQSTQHTRHTRMWRVV